MKKLIPVLISLLVILSIASAESIIVKTTVDNVYLRDRNGSVVTSIPRGKEVEVNGYDSTLDMFSATYGGKSGYLKGTGLSISRDELYQRCEQPATDVTATTNSEVQIQNSSTQTVEALTDDQLRLLYDSASAEMDARGMSTDSSEGAQTYDLDNMSVGELDALADEIKKQKNAATNITSSASKELEADFKSLIESIAPKDATISYPFFGLDNSRNRVYYSVSGDCTAKRPDKSKTQYNGACAIYYYDSSDSSYKRVAFFTNDKIYYYNADLLPYIERYTPQSYLKKLKGTPSVSDTAIAPDATPVPMKSYSEWAKEYKEKGIAIIEIPADTLYEYRLYFTGKAVFTVMTVDSTSGSSFKAESKKNTSWSRAFDVRFDDANELKGVGEKDKVSIIGVIEEQPDSTIVFKHCHIVSKGDKVSNDETIIQSKAEESLKTAQKFKSDYEKAVADKAAKEIQDYKQSCSTYRYNNIERNPNDFKGKRIKLSGKVIQVSEGWFSTTLRITDNDGNTWYVDYDPDKDASRILENDRVTVYGECTGVTTYTTIFGASVTIPSIDAKYIDLRK